jgi:hypothetical protein
MCPVVNGTSSVGGLPNKVRASTTADKKAPQAAGAASTAPIHERTLLGAGIMLKYMSAPMSI